MEGDSERRKEAYTREKEMEGDIERHERHRESERKGRQGEREKVKDIDKDI